MGLERLFGAFQFVGPSVQGLRRSSLVASPHNFASRLVHIPHWSDNGVILGNGLLLLR